MKRYTIKFISALLLLCICASLFFACRKEPTGDGAGESVADTSSQTEPDGPSDGGKPVAEGIPMSELSKYVIVYPQNASEMITEQVSVLTEAIRTRFGVLMMSKTDYINELSQTYRVGEHEILIGDTNREESDAFVGGLKYKDYGYKLIGKKIVISGVTDDSLEDAITMFISNVILGHLDSELSFMTEAQSKVVSIEYYHGNITLGGVDISEYRIVYPEGGTALERNLAEDLSYMFTETCGVIPLEVTSDVAAYSDGYEILVGKTNRLSKYSVSLGEGEGYYSSEGKLVSLWGNTALGNVCAVNALKSSVMRVPSSETLALEPVNGKIDADDDSTMSIMSFNVFSGKKEGFAPPDERKDEMAAVITKYLPDIVGLQEIHNDTILNSVLTEEGFCGLLDYYDYTCYSCPQQAYGHVWLDSPILYAKEKYSVVESGIKWLSQTPDIPSRYPGAYDPWVLSWAVFERRSDGLRFLVLNTHNEFKMQIWIEEAGIIGEFLKDYQDMPYILTGDLNRGYVDGMKWLLDCADLTDSKDMTDDLDYGGYTDGFIDYIMFNDYYADASRFEVNTWKPGGVEPSDHSAIYCEFSFNMDGTELSEKTPVTQSKDPGYGLDMEGYEFSAPIWFPNEPSDELEPVYPTPPMPEPEPEPEPTPNPETDIPVVDDTGETEDGDEYGRPNWFE